MTGAVTRAGFMMGDVTRAGSVMSDVVTRAEGGGTVWRNGGGESAVLLCVMFLPKTKADTERWRGVGLAVLRLAGEDAGAKGEGGTPVGVHVRWGAGEEMGVE